MLNETFGEQVRECRVARFEIALDDDGAGSAGLELVRELSNERRYDRVFGAMVSEPARTSHDGP